MSYDGLAAVKPAYDRSDELIFDDVWSRVDSWKSYRFWFICGNYGFCQFFVYYTTVVCAPDHSPHLTGRLRS